MTGAIYVTVVVLACYVGGLALQIVFGLVTFMLLWEFTGLFSESKYDPDSFFIPVFGLILYMASIPAFESLQHPRHINDIIILLAIIAGSFTLISINELRRKSTQPVLNIAIGIAGLVYIVPAMILINGFAVLSYEHQIFPLLGIFIMIWCADTFAYLIGRKIGKTKMAEKISPNKSWEGFIAGIIFSVGAGIIIAYFVDDQPYLAYGLLGLVVAVFGTIGDLVESMIKRSLGLKDSGTILPGHGGLLDRFDSVLFAIPAGFFFCVFTWKYLI